MPGKKNNKFKKYIAILLGCLILLCIGAFFDMFPAYIRYKSAKREFAAFSRDYYNLEKNYNNLKEQYALLTDEYDEKKNSPSGLLSLIKLAYDADDWNRAIELCDELLSKFPDCDEYGRAMEYKKAAQSSINLAEEEKERHKYETGITYANVALQPSKYKGSNVSFNGRVLQSIEGSNGRWIRLAVNNDINSVVFAEFGNDTADRRIYADEMVRIYGVADGLFTYNSVSGTEITIPKIKIDRIGLD